MGTFTDRLILQIDARFNNAIKGFSIIEGHLNKLKNSFAKIDSIRNFESTLRRINVGMKSNGKYFDLVTNKIISQTAALQRYDHFKRRGVFNDPNLFADLGIGDVSQKINKVGFSEKILAQVTREMNSALKDSSTQFKKVNKVAKTFDMRLLGMMFAGMAMQRAFGGVLKSITNTFLKTEDNTSGLTQATVRLSGAWEFLKFSIFDALNTDFFINMIDGVVNAVNWMSQLKDSAKITFLAITAGLFLIGSGFMLLGQTKLGWDAMFGMGGFFRNTNAINSKTMGASGVLTKLRNFAAAGFAIKMLFDIENYLNGEMGIRSLIDTLGMDLALMGLATGNPWMIGIGLVPKLLPLGTKLSGMGKSLVESGLERNKDRDPSMWGDLLGKTTDILSITGGFALWGAGIPLEFLDVGIKNLEAFEENAKLASTSIDTGLNNSITNSTNNINETFIPAIQNLGTNISTTSANSTTDFISASDSRITQIDKEIEKYDEYIRKQQDALNKFGIDSGTYVNSSSVSD